MVGLREVDPHSPSSHGEKEHRRRRVVGERLYIHATPEAGSDQEGHISDTAKGGAGYPQQQTLHLYCCRRNPRPPLFGASFISSKGGHGLAHMNFQQCSLAYRTTHRDEFHSFDSQVIVQDIMLPRAVSDTSYTDM